MTSHIVVHRMCRRSNAPPVLDNGYSSASDEKNFEYGHVNSEVIKEEKEEEKTGLDLFQRHSYNLLQDLRLSDPVSFSVPSDVSLSKRQRNVYYIVSHKLVVTGY